MCNIMFAVFCGASGFLPDDNFSFADAWFMYLFMVVLQVCIFFPKIHFGSRGYSFGLLSFQIFLAS